MASVAFLGRGGQGIVFAATITAETLFNLGYYVAQLQSYGAEVRGGSVLAHIVYDNKTIENPFIEQYDLAIVLHEAGLKRWIKHLEKSKTIIVDKDLVKTRMDNMVTAPIIENVAREKLSGSENIVAVGIAMQLLLGREAIAVAKSILEKRSSPEKNIKALELGTTIALNLGINMA